MARSRSKEEQERLDKMRNRGTNRSSSRATESGGSLAGPLEMLERKLDNGNYDQELAMKRSTYDQESPTMKRSTYDQESPTMRRGGSYNNAATYNDKDGFANQNSYNSAATYNNKDGLPSEVAGPLAPSTAQGMQAGLPYPTDRPLPQRPRQEPTRDPNRPQFDSFSDMFSSIFSKK